MASVLFDIAKSGFLSNVVPSQAGTTIIAPGVQLDWIDDNVRAVLVNTSVGVAGTDRYVFSASDDTLVDIPVGARLADIAVTGKGRTATGIATAPNLNFGAVPAQLAGATPKNVNVMILYRAVGAALPTVGEEPDCILIAYHELTVPVTPNGGTITINWNNGINTNAFVL